MKVVLSCTPAKPGQQRGVSKHFSAVGLPGWHTSYTAVVTCFLPRQLGGLWEVYAQLLRLCAGDQGDAQTASPFQTAMASPGAFALWHLDADQSCKGHQNNLSLKDAAVVLAAPTRGAWRLVTAAQQ